MRTCTGILQSVSSRVHTIQIMKTMIKIASRWSGEGGSTESLIELCNMFNRRGHEAVFYGPQNYHLGKCRGLPLSEFELSSADIFIGHFIELPQHPACQMSILSCHEKETFPLQKKAVQGYDVVRFVSASQRSWHEFTGRSVVIPDNVCELRTVATSEGNTDVAGVIGTILPAKQTHISIQRALADGKRLVRIYGNIGDQKYFDEQVKPMLSVRVVYHGHIENKQSIYGAISCVYHSSVSETFGLVKAECLKAGIPFLGTTGCDIDIEIMTGDELFSLWNKLLGLD